MSAADFFDPNVLLYIVSNDQPKRQRAGDLLLGICLACSVHTPNIGTHELGSISPSGTGFRFTIRCWWRARGRPAAAPSTAKMHHGQRIEGLTIRNPFRN